MNLSRFYGICLFAAAVTHLAPVAHAQTLNVDFSNEAAANQAGFELFDWGSGNTVSNTSGSFASAMATDGTIDVTLSGSQARDRNGTLPSLLGIDFLFRNNSHSVTLGDLNAGTYNLTTYHHDVNSNVNAANMAVSDAAGTNDIRVFAPSRSGGTSGPVQQYDTFIVADGTNPITLDFSGSGNTGILNGFTLTAATPPADLRIDFGEDIDQNATGYQGMNQPTDTANTQQTFGSTIGANNFVTVDVFMNGAATGNNNRYDERNGTDPLFRDVLMTSGDQIEITLNNLLAGEFDLTLHHGTDGNSFSGDVDLLIDGVEEITAQGQQPFGSFLLEDLVSDGINPVVITYEKADTGAPSWLHVAGLEVSNFTPANSNTVPEPASVVIWGMLSLAGVMFAFFRRRKRARDCG